MRLSENCAKLYSIWNVAASLNQRAQCIH